jgi:hypothetical protein
MAAGGLRLAMTSKRLVRAIVILLAVASQGCAEVGLTLFGVGAGVAAGTGTGYTRDGVAYRTFTASLEDVRRATLASFRRMDIGVKSDESTPEGRKIVALAGDRTLDIELEQLTARTTRMRVVAKHGVLFRDRATAGEVVAQTERALHAPSAARAR